MEWAITHPKANKTHRCEMCRRAISPGETYKRGAGFDGTAWSWKECAHCEAVLARYDLTWDGEYNEESFGEWASDGDCRTIQEARDMAGYRKQWRTKQGNLWPLVVTEPKEAR